MQKVWTDSDDVLDYRTGSVRAAFGAVAAGAAGVGLIAVGAFIPSNAAMVAVLDLIGIGVAVGGTVGVLRALDRSGIVVDRARGHVSSWRRAVAPLTVQTRALAEFWTVLLSMGRVQTRWGSRTVYLVGLHGEVGEPLTLHWHEDYRVAQQLAEEVAGFLRFPFTDASAVEIVVHAAGQSSAARREPGPSASPIPRVPPPTHMRCRVSQQGRTLVIEEPPVGKKRLVGIPLMMFFLLAIPCAALGAFAHFFGASSFVFMQPLLASAIVVAMLFVGFLAVVASSLPQLAQRRVVEAGPDGLRFRIQGPFATRDRSMRSDDLLELRIGLGHLCAITPRDYRVICGRVDQPLAHAELEWLRDQLSQALRTCPPPEEGRYAPAR